jgi:hypothetical protein
MTSTGLGHFVDNTAAPGGNGSQADPFDTLAAAIAAASAGDTIFVSRGDGTSGGLNGAFALPAGVDLIGEGAGLVVAQTIVLPGLAPLLTGPISCGGDNTISGFTIDGSASEGIEINAVGNVTVSGNTISNPTEEHIDCTNMTGTVTIDNNQFDDPPNGDNDFIYVENTDTNGTVNVTGNTFTNDPDNDTDSVTEVIVGGNSVVTANFTGNTALGASPDNFDYGFYLEANDTSDVTVTASSNMFSNTDNDTIGVHTDDDASLSGTIADNFIDDADDDEGIHAVLNSGTLTISGNTITDCTGDSLGLEVAEDGGTFRILNNIITNSGDDGMDFDETEDGDVNIAARGNTVTNSGSQSFDFDWNGAGTACIEFTGNTVTEEVRFDEDGPGTMNVEQLGNLENTGITGNVFNNMSSVNADADVNDVAAGSCNIP